MDAIMVFVGIAFILTGIVLQIAGMREPKPVKERGENESFDPTAVKKDLQIRGASLAGFGFLLNIVYFMFV